MTDDELTAAGKPLFGAERIASVIVAFGRSAARRGVAVDARPTRVNGHPGFFITENGRLAFHIERQL